jgi:hypothetical protein
MQDQIKELSKFFLYKDSKCYGKVCNVEIENTSIFFTADTVDDFEEITEIDFFGQLRLVEEGKFRNVVSDREFYVNSFNLGYNQDTDVVSVKLTLKDPLE